MDASLFNGSMEFNGSVTSSMDFKYERQIRTSSADFE